MLKKQWKNILILPLLFHLGFAADAESQISTTVIPTTELSRLNEAYAQIKQFYVDKVDDKKLIDNAIRGMIDGLDAHSNYLNEEDFNDLKLTTSGQFAGVGVEVVLQDSFLKVITAMDGSPAMKAGLLPDDIIIKIDNTFVRGLSLTDAIKKMRGEQGTKINLTVLRKNQKAPLIFHLMRSLVKVQSVNAKLLAPNIGYLKLNIFQETTAKDVEQGLKQMEKQNHGPLRGLVLDLRNNPGGLLDSAIDVANDFLEPKKLGKNQLIVYTQGRTGSQLKSYANGHDLLNGAPIVVLINEGTASAAEIVSGALQDHKRALLVGKKSFGKGSVQTIYSLDEKTGMKITTARYYTPNGRSIQAQGIQPDVDIENYIIPNTVLVNKNEDAFSLSESELQGHLLNTALPDTKTVLVKDETKELLHSDYQLFEAFNLLKAIVIEHSIREE